MTFEELLETLMDITAPKENPPISLVLISKAEYATIRRRIIGQLNANIPRIFIGNYNESGARWCDVSLTISRTLSDVYPCYMSVETILEPEHLDSFCTSLIAKLDQAVSCK